MAKIKEYFRITKNSRHQLYQIGFNEFNSCWLEGKWIDVPKEKWEAVKDEHHKMYCNIDYKSNNHRGKGTKLEDMTKAQRKAWEYFSGNKTFNLYNEKSDNFVKHRVVGLDMAGNTINEKSLKWLKKSYISKGYLIIRYVSSYGEITEQTKGLFIPDDLLFNNTAETAIDTTRLVIDQNVTNDYNMMKEVFSNCPDDPEDFMLTMAVTQLVLLEESIIRDYWNRKNGTPDFYDDTERNKKWYKELREIAEERLPKSFLKVYEPQKESHNSCSRSNLDNSGGSLGCYVIPKFNKDGSHEEMDPHDGPWKSHDNVEGTEGVSA